MTGLVRSAIAGAICTAALASGSAAVSAAEYPDRPVHWLIAASPGGPVERATRLMAQWLSDHFGQPFIVENRVGTDGPLAAAKAIAAPADGYTLLLSGADEALRAARDQRAPVDVIRDTVPVAGFMQVPLMLVMSGAMPVKTLRELLNFCKANPRRIALASPGGDNAVRMSVELFRTMTRCEMVRVAYSDTAGAYSDMAANKVQLIFDNLSTAMQQARSGHMRAIAVTSASRLPTMPDTPTVAETMPGFEAALVYGLSAPQGTPPDVIDVLSKAVSDALNDPKLAARLAGLGGIPMPMKPGNFGKLMADETERWRKVAAAGLGWSD
jgi:tripartite-type tricarboxylate transporter receptor subunit TctC